MRLTRKVEADHAEWIENILRKIADDIGAQMDDLTRARLQSAQQHADILNRSMCERVPA